jgi:hypothetical protein
MRERKFLKLLNLIIASPKKIVEDFFSSPNDFLFSYYKTQEENNTFDPVLNIF